MDSIVDELDRLRAEQMKRFNFDFDAFYRDLKEQENRLAQRPLEPPKSPRKHVQRPMGSTVRKAKTCVDPLIKQPLGNR